MKNLKPFYSFIAVVTVAAFFTIVSCSKDSTSATPSQTDVRDLAVGNYTGNANLTDSVGNKQFDTTTTIVIAKGPGKTLTITEEGNTITTSDIVSSGNNISGSIPSQSVKFNGQDATIIGKGPNNDQLGYQDAQKVFTYTFEITDGQLKGYTYMVYANKK